MPKLERTLCLIVLKGRAPTSAAAALRDIVRAEIAKLWKLGSVTVVR